MVKKGATTNKAEAVLHPVRLRLVQRLAAAGQSTPSSLGTALDDIPPATLYRHLNKLVEAGVVEVVSQRKVRGATERVFALAHQRANLNQQDIADATVDDHHRWFLTFALGLYEKFSRYLGPSDATTTSPNFERDGVGYHTLPLWLSDEEFSVFAADLNRVVLEAAQKGPEAGRVLRSFSTVIMPEVDVPKDDAE